MEGPPPEDVIPSTGGGTGGPPPDLRVPASSISSPQVLNLGNPRLLHIAPRGQFSANFDYQLHDGANAEVMRFSIEDVFAEPEGSDTQVHLLSECRRGRFQCVVLEPPCSQFSRALFANTKGQPPVRDHSHPDGLPHLSDHEWPIWQKVGKAFGGSLLEGSFEVPFGLAHQHICRHTVERQINQ